MAPSAAPALTGLGAGWRASVLRRNSALTWAVDVVVDVRVDVGNQAFMGS